MAASVGIGIKQGKEQRMKGEGKAQRRGDLGGGGRWPGAASLEATSAAHRLVLAGYTEAAHKTGAPNPGNPPHANAPAPV